MIEVGRVCIKIAGRDAGKKCAIIDVIDNNFVLIDGFSRRRKCNIRHLEPIDKKIEADKESSKEQIIKMLGA
ncbi:MAG TPA: 50S ribosomal protein L14e [Candidatus Nanoarchaeia archaeon]|nr:50S ribosomal protein L14e [Candidatus Nanoarchaeia archaeon]